MDGFSCTELALEGEKLCKRGDCFSGVEYFHKAIEVGTDDSKILSAIYSQLGNAYFYLGDYGKAMEYHSQDLTLARSTNDRIGEATASGNLGSTLKVIGKFDEATQLCQRHLDISRELNDKIGESRALYNLANVYHTKGKHIGRLDHQEPGNFPEEVKSCLLMAVDYYEQNLKLMKELGEGAAQGRACGNLGNTHYLLGNFEKAITYHNERLKLSKEFGDKAAERRAHTNLGNAHLFLSQFVIASEHYRKALALSKELGDKAVEAQACYCLGNTYTLLHDYSIAIKYHLCHMKIAIELRDSVGESRACWSLSNAHLAQGNHSEALEYASKHLEICKEIGDVAGQATAQITLLDLQNIISSSEKNENQVPLEDKNTARLRRISMEKMNLLKLTPDVKNKKLQNQLENLNSGNPDNTAATQMTGSSIGLTSHKADALSLIQKEGSSPDINKSMDEDSFFELVTRFQSKRMDDQRCSLIILDNKENEPTYPPSTRSILGNKNGSVSCPNVPSVGSVSRHDAEHSQLLKEELMDLIAGMQSKRMDEQRASLPGLPGLNNNPPAPTPPPILQHLSDESIAELPDENFFDMLMRCQSSRLEDQRSKMPQENQQPNHHPRPPLSPAPPPSGGAVGGLSLSGNGMVSPTMPDEDFFSLIMRVQSGRLEDQRSVMPNCSENTSSSKSGSIKSNRSSRSKR